MMSPVHPDSPRHRHRAGLAAAAMPLRLPASTGFSFTFVRPMAPSFTFTFDYRTRESSLSNSASTTPFETELLAAHGVPRLLREVFNQRCAASAKMHKAVAFTSCTQQVQVVYV